MSETRSSLGQLRLALEFAREIDVLTAVRLILVADVLTRATEDVQEGRIIVTALRSDVGTFPEARAMARALNVSPSILTALRVDATPVRDVVADRTPRSDLLMTTASGKHASVPGPRVIVGMVQRPGAAAPNGLVRHGRRDPLALRLALLRFSPEGMARLSQARLNRADETLDRWRFKVAGWHEMTPHPAPPHTMAAMHERLLTDLDTRTVLSMLHRLEVDHAVSSGAKYQIFNRLDGILGLELDRLVGKVRR